MDVVGCAASVCQLVVYSASSAVSLKKLYDELIHGGSTYRDEAANIKLLLHTLQRLSRHHFDDHNPVLPVLISISGIACEVLNLLQLKQTFGISWRYITSREKINSAFETLNNKRNLLHLHISQSHQEALVDLRQSIKSSCGIHHTTMSTQEANGRAASQCTQDTATTTMVAPTNQTAQRQSTSFVLNMNDSNIAGQNRIMNRVQLPPTAELSLQRMHVERHAVNSIGNDQELSQEITQQTSVQQATTINPSSSGAQTWSQSQNMSIVSRGTFPSYPQQHTELRPEEPSTSEDDSCDIETAHSGGILGYGQSQTKRLGAEDSSMDIERNMSKRNRKPPRKLRKVDGSSS